MRACFFIGLALAATLACSNDETQDDDSTSTNTTSQSTTTTTSAGGNGTGGTGTGGTGTGGSCTSAAALELTSTAVEDMGLLPAQYKCNGFVGGMNISPPLQWTPGPAGTLSYGIIFRDLTNPLIHSAIWDIPGCVFELPEDVEKTANPTDVAGAKQCRAYSGAYGYEGPCAPGYIPARTYQFEIFAIDVATIPEITTESTRPEVEAAMQAHSLASDTLTVIDQGDDP